MAESFVKTFKRDYVAFGDLQDARTVMEKLHRWFDHYNEIHPHSALKYLSPRMFRREQSKRVPVSCYAGLSPSIFSPVYWSLVLRLLVQIFKRGFPQPSLGINDGLQYGL